MEGRMDGWMDGWMDGRTDGWMDGVMDGWTDGWMGWWMDGWRSTDHLNDNWMVCQVPKCSPSGAPAMAHVFFSEIWFEGDVVFDLVRLLVEFGKLPEAKMDPNIDFCMLFGVFFLVECV